MIDKLNMNKVYDVMVKGIACSNVQLGRAQVMQEDITSLLRVISGRGLIDNRLNKLSVLSKIDLSKLNRNELQRFLQLCYKARKVIVKIVNNDNYDEQLESFFVDYNNTTVVNCV